MVLVGTLGDTLVEELAGSGTVKFPNCRALVPYYSDLFHLPNSDKN